MGRSDILLQLALRGGFENVGEQLEVSSSSRKLKRSSESLPKPLSGCSSARKSAHDQRKSEEVDVGEQTYQIPVL